LGNVNELFLNFFDLILELLNKKMTKLKGNLNYELEFFGNPDNYNEMI